MLITDPQTKSARVDPEAVADAEQSLRASSHQSAAGSMLSGDHASEPPTSAGPSARLEGSLLMLVVAVLWGTNFPAVKALIESGLPTEAAAALRFGLAAFALSPLLFRNGPLPRELVTGGLECGAWLALGYIAQAVALQDAQAGVVAFIASLQVVFVPLALSAFGDKALTPRLALSAALCVAGVGVLELGGGGGAASGPGVSEALALLQPIAFGTSYLRIERLAARYPEHGLQISALQLVSNAAISAAWCAHAAMGSADALDLSALAEPPVLGGLLWTGLVSTALTVLLQTRALSKLPATDSSVIVATEPLWAAGFAALLLGESLDSSKAVGGALIVAGCLANALLPADAKGVEADETSRDAHAAEEEALLRRLALDEGAAAHPQQTHGTALSAKQRGSKRHTRAAAGGHAFEESRARDGNVHARPRRVLSGHHGDRRP